MVVTLRAKIKTSQGRQRWGVQGRKRGVNRRNATSLRDTVMGRHRWKRLMISNGITRKWHHEKMTRYIKRHDPWNDITRKYHHDKMTQYIKRHDSWNDITWKWLSTWNDTGGSHHVTVLKIAFSECIHDCRPQTRTEYVHKLCFFTSLLLHFF